MPVRVVYLLLLHSTPERLVPRVIVPARFALAVVWLRCGLGVDKPHIGVLFHGGGDGGLSRCFSHGEDVRSVLMIVLVFARKRVGQVVKVDDDVALGGVLADKGGFARRRTMAAP